MVFRRQVVLFATATYVLARSSCGLELSATKSVLEKPEKLVFLDNRGDDYVGDNCNNVDDFYGNNICARDSEFCTKNRNLNKKFDVLVPNKSLYRKTKFYGKDDATESKSTQNTAPKNFIDQKLYQPLQESPNNLQFELKLSEQQSLEKAVERQQEVPSQLPSKSSLEEQPLEKQQSLQQQQPLELQKSVEKIVVAAPLEEQQQSVQQEQQNANPKVTSLQNITSQPKPQNFFDTFLEQLGFAAAAHASAMGGTSLWFNHLLKKTYPTKAETQSVEKSESSNAQPKNDVKSQIMEIPEGGWGGISFTENVKGFFNRLDNRFDDANSLLFSDVYDYTF